MDLYFAGAEQPIYLRQLDDLGAKHIAISFYEWQRRHSSDDLRKHVPIDMKVCITAGVSRKEIDFIPFGKSYVEFCERNADEDTLIYDMDAPACPLNVRQSVRDQLSPLPNLVVFPAKEEDTRRLAKEHENIGINSRMIKGTQPNELRRIQATLYGSNITDPKTLRVGRFAATTSMAWLSGRRYGELWVFARGKLHHYSAEALVKAVRAHTRDITALGGDPQACAANDLAALTSVAIQSMLSMAESLSGRPRDRQQAEVSGASPKWAEGQNTQLDVTTPDTSLQESGAMQSIDREKVTLPVISSNAEVEGGKVEAVSESFRQCDTCYLSTVCPKYEEHHACAFDIPVHIRTPKDIEQAGTAILDFQFQRISFGHFAEQADGGAMTPRLGQEMDRFFTILNKIKDLNGGVPMGNQGGGALDRAFGEQQSPETLEEMSLGVGSIGDQTDEEDDEAGYAEAEIIEEGEEQRFGLRLAGEEERPSPSY